MMTMRRSRAGDWGVGSVGLLGCAWSVPTASGITQARKRWAGRCSRIATVDNGRVDADSGPEALSRQGRALVGRVAERAVLADRLRDALDGRRQLVLVAGEPGAGKTRLAEDAADQARALGAISVLGRAAEDAGSPPYWPFLQVFRGLAGHPPAPLLDGLAGGAQERFRLFEVTAEALAAAADPTGLLVVLDDLQWADAATIQLLPGLVDGHVHLAFDASADPVAALADRDDAAASSR